MSGDTGFVTVTGNWSGTYDPVPAGATLLIDPIYEYWHQVGPNQVQISYQQTYTVDDLPETLQVVKELTYAGPEVLPSDMILTISNIEVYCDEVQHTLHSEWDEHLAPAPRPTPALTGWGIIILCILLLGCTLWVIVKKRKAATISI